MDTKARFRIGEGGPKPPDHWEETSFRRVGRHMQTVLWAAKNRIAVPSNTSISWDSAKRATNLYENIYRKTLPKTPVSRSFFKMWEIACDWNLASDCRPMQFAYVAEAPGGFIQAMVAKRSKTASSLPKNVRDNHRAISLSKPTPGVPSWRLSRSWMTANAVTLEAGSDGTGDVYKFENIKAFARGDADLVTADGGFDFSNAFNEQETVFTRLLVAEVLCAHEALAENGTLILKIFDCFTDPTAAIIGLLVKWFRSVESCKPLTSRPANSEKYLVCLGFRGKQRNDAGILIRALNEKDDARMLTRLASEATPPPEILWRISLLNLATLSRQLDSIVAALRFMSGSGSITGSPDQMAIRQEKAADDWNLKYGVTTSRI